MSAVSQRKNTLGRRPVHPFPARMAPTIALGILKNEKQPIRVLDPMMGSGTVPAMARALGHQSFGVDIDPLAVLIAKVWTTSIDPSRARMSARTVLLRAKTIGASMRSRDAYPIGADQETKRFIRYWFDDYARVQLASLAVAISRCRQGSMRDLLWCAFSRLIITKENGASLAKDLAHSRPHKFFERAPLKPFGAFLDVVDRVLEGCISKNGSQRGPRATIKLGDARRLKIPAASIDLVLTSPPYLNAIDYLRCSKFTLVWMGCSTGELRDLRRKSVGCELGLKGGASFAYAEELMRKARLFRKLSSRHRGILAQFIEDMRLSICEVARVLTPGGRAVYVLGENTIKETYIPNSKLLTAIGRDQGLRLHSRSSRKLPPNRRYLPPPTGKSGALDSRMRREVILIFEKPQLRLHTIGRRRQSK